ncbi:hypothetical protein VMHJH2_06240 [Streptococcus uberis]|uniref:hypothetical protein n=1 Tax=Streptococcus uberis TaxID=1349 RepID=UPI00214FB969|nr:hypothetical protein [Streptococcus uberis]MCR4258117.1 hypothetical protein [Streptococcus uberis]
MMVYSEYERRLVAGTEYKDYDVGVTVTIGEKESIKKLVLSVKSLLMTSVKKLMLFKVLIKKKYQSFIEDLRVQEHQDLRWIV